MIDATGLRSDISAPAVLRTEHDQVLAQLSARVSTLHLAHSAVSGFLGLTLLATAAKLWWDYSEYYPERWTAAVSLAGVALVYSLGRLIVGITHFKAERVKLERLRTLRKELGVDDPSVMLPGLNG